MGACWHALPDQLVRAALSSRLRSSYRLIKPFYQAPVLTVGNHQQRRPLNDGNNMKRMIIGIALAVLTLGAAQAQDKQQKTPAERAKHQTERMTKELGLNADQTAKVQTINAKYAEKAEALRADRKAKVDQTKGKGAELNSERMADLKAVLTPEQYSKCEKNMEAVKEKRQEKRKEMKGDKKQ